MRLHQCPGEVQHNLQRFSIDDNKTYTSETLCQINFHLDLDNFGVNICDGCNELDVLKPADEM